VAEAVAPGASFRPGDVVWARPELAVGREHAGRRPGMVVAGAGYLEIVDALAVVVPITTVDRGWPNHVEVVGAELGRRSWAMSEQVRTISRERVVGRAGRVDPATLATVRGWIADFLEL
jgi:mRNA interferase MazF